ncbi:hypothetical protein D3C72_132480 [compost metagenome]
MAKNTLLEKIKIVGFWTFGGVFWYLVIAFFLKSSYPIYEYDFNRSTAYDVLKDALTLAAAFLAPIAAFVLFSDWRREHVEKKIENDSELVIKDINLIMRNLLQYLKIIACGDKGSEERGLQINNSKNILLVEIDSLVRDIKRINESNKMVGEFKGYALEISKALKESTGKMYKLDRKFQISDKEFSPSFIEIDSSIKNLNNQINLLNDLQINLKIRN